MPEDQTTSTEDPAKSPLARHTEAIDRLHPRAEEYLKDEAKKGLKQALMAYYRLDAEHSEMDRVRKLYYATLDHYDKRVLPAMFEAAGLDLVRIPEISRSFYPQTKYSAKVLDKEKTYAWLRETGNEGLITETVNSSSLAGFLKDMVLEQGIDPPEDACALTSYSGIGSSKYTPK